MIRSRLLFTSLLFTLISATLPAQRGKERIVYLESLDLSLMTQGYKSPMAGTNLSGGQLSLYGEMFGHGVGTHARSEFLVNLHGSVTRFTAVVGVDDTSLKKGSVVFKVFADNVLVAESPVMHGSDVPHRFDVDLKGAQQLALVVTTNGDGLSNDHADWAEARLYITDGATQLPEATRVSDPDPEIWMGVDSPAPAFGSPKSVGTTPGRPFLFLLPVTGEAPIEFRATGLPDGLSLDTTTGIIRGSVIDPGVYTVEMHASNAIGWAEGELEIVAGEHQLAQTPPMGWNSWNVWAANVTGENVRDAARALVESGLAAKGYRYINLDDGWQGLRNEESGVLPAKSAMGDMKELSDELHDMGLYLGIYSGPGPLTCAKQPGSYQYEQIDADTWAAWGIDYLKYDWCYYGRIAPAQPSVEDYQKPYRVMRAALDNADRDIVYSFCQYGMGKSWEWAGGLGGNLWRTTGDMVDTWASMSAIGFVQSEMAPYSGPGRWNDPDMLVVGRVGWGSGVRDSRLSRNEQVTHMTLWSLLAAPLLIGCDLTQLDDFTLAILGNPEVIAIDQDVLGKQATLLRRDEEEQTEVWSRPLADGSIAVGLFNRGFGEREVGVTWKELGIDGKQSVRDLWMRKEIGGKSDAVLMTVMPHGARLLKISP